MQNPQRIPWILLNAQHIFGIFGMLSARSETQIIVDGASYHGHTVDGTAVEPGAAPVVTFDQERSDMLGWKMCWVAW